MRHLLVGVTAVLVASLASAQFYGYKDQPIPGSSRVATDAAAAEVRVEQRLNQSIPLNLTFKDEYGKEILLADVFNKRPVVLLPIFYECPGICTDELNNLLKTLRGFRKDNVGETFDVIAVSIDESEDSTLAAAKKQTYVDVYDRAGTDQGWHFLTGDKENIKKLTDSLGFLFRRDPEGNIIHPACVVILTPTGRISRYFVTTEYPQRIFLDAIKDAGREKVGVRDERPFYLACINIDPLTGQRSLNIMNTLKVLGVLTMLGLFGSMIVMTVSARRAKGIDPEEPATSGE